MNWFQIVNFILALAPQEVALVKAIVDAAHAGHQNGTPLQPVQLAAMLTPSTFGTPSEMAASVPEISGTVSTATPSPGSVPITQTVPNTEKEVLQK